MKIEWCHVVNQAWCQQQKHPREAPYLNLFRQGNDENTFVFETADSLLEAVYGLGTVMCSPALVEGHCQGQNRVLLKDFSDLAKPVLPKYATDFALAITIVQLRIH
jgi:hypothetical protein